MGRPVAAKLGGYGTPDKLAALKQLLTLYCLLLTE